MEKVKDKKLLIATSIFVFIGIIGIAYAVFTQNLNISGTGVNRKSNFDIHFENLEQQLIEGTTVNVITQPTIQNNRTVIEDYNVTFATPGDSITYTFDVVNDGDYDATLTGLTLGPVKCSVNGDESNQSAQNVCSNIEYTMKYTDNNQNVSINDTLASKETKNVTLKLTYKEFDNANKLPTSNVSINNLGVDMVYTSNSTAKINSDGSTPYQKPTAVSTLLLKINDASITTYESNSEASHQMYMFSHPETEQTDALTDYRYIGNDPYNYVDFNCDDSGNNCETWRIIGVFTVKNVTDIEARIKIIRDDSLYGGMLWNNSDGYDSPNEWPSATLNQYLNGDYYASLSNSAKSMIEPAETYLGGRAADYSDSLYGTAEDMYVWERGTTRVYEGRSINDTKNITLAYPSDYTYTYANGVDNTCYSNVWNCRTTKGATPSLGWLYKSYYWWLVSPRSDLYEGAFYIHSKGYMHSNDVGRSSTYGVRPVVYLKSDVLFDGNHTGSESDHYKLKK